MSAHPSRSLSMLTLGPPVSELFLCKSSTAAIMEAQVWITWLECQAGAIGKGWQLSHDLDSGNIDAGMAMRCIFQH